MKKSEIVPMDKLLLVQDIGIEICEGCGPDRDCGEEYDECSRITNAIKYLDDFLEDGRE